MTRGKIHANTECQHGLLVKSSPSPLHSLDFPSYDEMTFSSIREYVQDAIDRMEQRDDFMLCIIDPRDVNYWERRRFAAVMEEDLTSNNIVELLDTTRLRGSSITHLRLESLEIDYQVGLALTRLFQREDRKWKNVTLRSCEGSNLASSLSFIVCWDNVVGLSLLENNLSQSRFESLTMILASEFSSLSELEMAEEFYDDEGRMLSQGLQVNTTLRSLCLYRCEFHERSLEFLSEGIAQHPFLAELNMSNCKLSDEECTLVLNEITDHPSLGIIKMGSNYCSTQTMKAAAACLKDN